MFPSGQKSEMSTEMSARSVRSSVVWVIISFLASTKPPPPHLHTEKNKRL